jgi:hypothetical protein
MLRGARSVACPLLSVSQLIEQYQLPAVDLLKVDVERAELEVLRGVEGGWKLSDSARHHAFGPAASAAAASRSTGPPLPRPHPPCCLFTSCFPLPASCFLQHHSNPAANMLGVLGCAADRHWPLVRQAALEVHAADLEEVLEILRYRAGFLSVVVEQEAALAGTSLHAVYCRR